MDKFSFKDVLVTFAGLLITSFIAWVLITATGNNPSEVALYLYEGGFKGTRNIANSLYQATPLILTAVATLISFRVGMFNIGINGSMYVGALYAGWAGYKFTTLGHFTHVTVCILIGMLAVSYTHLTLPPRCSV